MAKAGAVLIYVRSGSCERSAVYSGCTHAGFGRHEGSGAGSVCGGAFADQASGGSIARQTGETRGKTQLMFSPDAS